MEKNSPVWSFSAKEYVEEAREDALKSHCQGKWGGRQCKQSFANFYAVMNYYMRLLAPGKVTFELEFHGRILDKVQYPMYSLSMQKLVTRKPIKNMASNGFNNQFQIPLAGGPPLAGGIAGGVSLEQGIRVKMTKWYVIKQFKVKYFNYF